MKTTLFAAFFALALGAGAQSKPNYDSYCMQMTEGKLMVMYQGKILTHEVALDNSSRLKPDGSITKKNGDKIMLKDGDCVDPEGKITSAAKKPE